MYKGGVLGCVQCCRSGEVRALCGTLEFSQINLDPHRPCLLWSSLGADPGLLVPVQFFTIVCSKLQPMYCVAVVVRCPHAVRKTKSVFVHGLNTSVCYVLSKLPRAVSTQALSGAGFLKMLNKATDAVSKMTIKMNESDVVSIASAAAATVMTRSYSSHRNVVASVFL